MNPFISVLQNRGFTLGASDRWLSPGFKQGDNLMVEIDGDQAIVTGDDLRVRAVFPSTPEAVQEFRNFLPI